MPFDAVPALRTLLEGQRRDTRAVKLSTGQVVPWVFHRGGREIKSIRPGGRTACAKAGVRNRIPHDCRRTALRNLVRAGIPEKVAMAITGHETRSVFDRYNIVAGNDPHDAMQRLAAYHAQRSTVRKAHLRHTQDPETNKTPRNSEGFAMEARGIEPRSEPQSNTASTRVGCV